MTNDLAFQEIPKEIMDAERKITDWMRMNSYKNWELGGIKARFAEADPLPLDKAMQNAGVHTLEKVTQAFQNPQESVPLEAKDLSKYVWIRNKGASFSRQPIGIEESGIYILSASNSCDIVFESFESLFFNGEMSTDLKTWKPCRKEREA